MWRPPPKGKCEERNTHEKRCFVEGVADFVSGENDGRSDFGHKTGAPARLRGRVTEFAQVGETRGVHLWKNTWLSTAVPEGKKG